MGSLGYYSKLSFQAPEEVIPKKNFCLQSQMTIEPWNHGTIEPKISNETSLQCRRFHRARANGFNRESAMLKLPKRGGNGVSPHTYRLQGGKT